MFSMQKKILHTIAYSERVGFRWIFWEEELWKKFNTKFKFLCEPTYRICQDRLQRKGNIQLHVQSVFPGWLSVVWNEPEKKRNLNSNTKCGYFIDKLFHITYFFVTVLQQVSFCSNSTLHILHFMLFYSIVLFLFYVYLICAKVRVESITLSA